MILSGIRSFGRLAAVAAATCGLVVPAFADLKLCNRMSYVIDAAIAVEEHGAAATRGWFRVDPGQCRAIMQGAPPAGRIYLHARVPAVYGPSPISHATPTEFCVSEGDFVTGGARNCRAGQTPVPFNAVQPSPVEEDFVVYLAEDAEYSEEQAHDAGIQRLLVAAGYDATPIDGIRGNKTDAALSQFIQDNRLSVTAAGRSDFFKVLLDAAQKPGTKFSWCNDTANVVMAAIGAQMQDALVTRGWYRVEPGTCLRPDILGQPRMVYSFAEAVDKDGRPVSRDGKPLVWGGSEMMCTRSTKFEIADQADCAAKGLTASGFAAIDLTGKTPATVRFK